MGKLNPQQEEFCYRYIALNYNAYAAYREIYGENKDRSNAYKLLKKPDVAAKVAEIRKSKLDALQIDADRVTEKLARIAFAAPDDLYYNAGSQLKALELLQKQLVSTKPDLTIEVGLVKDK